MNGIVLAVAGFAVWLGFLYVHPFGRCLRCWGAGHIQDGKRRRRVCPRCKGRRRVQYHGSRTVHRLVFKIRDGQRAAARYHDEES